MAKQKYKICVDLDSAREDADYLEEQIIEADNEDSLSLLRNPLTGINDV